MSRSRFVVLVAVLAAPRADAREAAVSAGMTLVGQWIASGEKAALGELNQEGGASCTWATNY